MGTQAMSRISSAVVILVTVACCGPNAADGDGGGGRCVGSACYAIIILGNIAVAFFQPSPSGTVHRGNGPDQVLITDCGTREASNR